MDPEVRRERHRERWELGNTAIARAAIGGLLFAALVLFNVLVPYSKTERERMALERAAQRVEEVEDELDAMVGFQSKLVTVADRVEKAPWNDHKEDLKQRFREGRVQDARREATQTIDRIAADVRKQVIEPLSTAARNESLPSEVTAVPQEFSESLEVWTQQHRITPWYTTVQAKDRTLHELDTDMRNIQSDVQVLVADVQKRIATKEKELSEQKDTLEKQTRDQAAELQAALDAAIPAWARGLIKVDQMVVLYPFLLMAIALYVVARGFATAGHYANMAELSGWSREDRRDPVMSSLWTLTWRGPLGTATTLGCYLGVLAALWFLLIEGLHVTKSDALPEAVPHFIMTLAVGVVLATSLKNRPQ